jgi:hypothetical protein
MIYRKVTNSFGLADLLETVLESLPLCELDIEIRNHRHCEWTLQV